MFQENIKKIEIKNTLSTTKKNSHPFNASVKYHVCVGSIQSKLNCKQTSKQVQAATLSPPEGNLEAKVSNPQKMCRIEMTCEDRSGPAGADAPPPRIVCGDHFDPEVGTWVMDDPQVPWRPLLKSLRQDCESIQAHSS